MNLIEIITLGALQGFTEFFPVSSSGHLVLFQNIFNINQPGITLDIFLHTGTLLSVTVVFRKDIVKLINGFLRSLNLKKNEKTGYEKLAWLILIANIPAGLAGILLKDKIEVFFQSSYAVFVFLIVTGVYLFVSKFSPKGKLDMKNLNLPKSILIGIGQMVAILPGISRSGMTITTGMFLKLTRKDAAKFSFFIMLPAVAGATLLEAVKLDMASVNILALVTGIIMSFVSGCVAIKILLKIIQNYKLHYFSYYCILAGVAGILII